MEKILEGNSAQLVGTVLSELEFSHKTYGEAFYILLVGILRKSGYEDDIRLMISERLIGNMDLKPERTVRIAGQVRTYNQEREGKNHLNVVVFVRELELLEEAHPHENRICLEGYVCKPPIRRTSPLGREICDLMLAVNRMYNKSDYIPCIAWGRNAAYGGTLAVGCKLLIEGRIQSREYKKRSDVGEICTKEAYEVSVIRMEELQPSTT